ncbi:hypothetical protein [Jiangella anatolica]|nr:hypothetical protein [Jiangella anatolica]
MAIAAAVVGTAFDVEQHARRRGARAPWVLDGGRWRRAGELQAA